MDWLGLYLLASVLIWALFYKHTEQAGFSALFAVLWPLVLVGMFVVLLIAPEQEGSER